MEVFSRNNFIIQQKLKDFKDAEGIMDTSMNLLCYVKHGHSWKEGLVPSSGPGSGSGLRRGDIRTTAIQLEGVDGTLLGEIHEAAVPWKKIGITTKWYIYDAKGSLKGAVREKQKFLGADWLLEDPEEKVVATIKGDRKKHNYEVLTPDNQVIARCHTEAAMSEDSYGVDILGSDFDPFLVLSYIVVLDHVKVLRTTREGLFRGR